MILVVSQQETEHTTNLVLDWLAYKRAPFLRVNGNHFEQANSFQMQLSTQAAATYEFTASVNGAEVTAVWFRRWVPKHFLQWVYEMDLAEGAKHELKDYLKAEFTTLRDHFCESLGHCFRLGDLRPTLNKLLMLEAARKAGLHIPRTLATNNKRDLALFLDSFPSLIVKNIQDLFLSSRPNNDILASLTNSVTAQDLQSLPDTFFPSLFQQRVEKQFEIRVFYLDGTCYSMAIFSQSDPQTALDFRNYNAKHPNRNVPYQLPQQVEQQLGVLMSALGLNTGSIDLIKDEAGEYVFLEVNPAGQFGMVSEPCNYFLEEKVANLLIYHAKQHAN